MLIDRGANVRAVSSTHSRSALHYAVIGGNQELVALLIDSGADWRGRDNWGVTPFGLACGYGKLEIVRMMLENGQVLHLHF